MNPMNSWMEHNGAALLDAEALFRRNPVDLECFHALAAAVAARWSEASLKVHRTQISFCDPRPFCYAWVRARRFYVTFGLDMPIENPRINMVVEPYPNRWTHHVAVSEPNQIDDQLLDWIDLARRFKRSLGKGCRS